MNWAVFVLRIVTKNIKFGTSKVFGKDITMTKQMEDKVYDLYIFSHLQYADVLVNNYMFSSLTCLSVCVEIC